MARTRILDVKYETYNTTENIFTDIDIKRITLRKIEWIKLWLFIKIQKLNIIILPCLKLKIVYQAEL